MQSQTLSMTRSAGFPEGPLSDPFVLISFILRIVEAIAWLLCIPLEVFLRRNFGTRYFKSMGIFTPSLIIWFMIASSTTFDFIGTGLSPGILMGPFTGAFFVAFAVHRFAVIRRSFMPQEYHSYYSGTPYSLWLDIKIPGGLYRLLLLPDKYCVTHPVSEYFVKRFVEPMFCLLMSVMVYFVDMPLGIFIAAASVAMSLKHNLEFYRLEQMRMNDADMMLESRIRQELHEDHRQPYQNCGVHLVRPAIVAPQRRSRPSTSVDAAAATRPAAVMPVLPAKRSLAVATHPHARFLVCQCGHRMQTDDRNVGRWAQCQECRRYFRIPPKESNGTPDPHRTRRASGVEAHR